MNGQGALNIGIVGAPAEMQEELRAALSSSNTNVLFERSAHVSADELRASICRLRPDVLLIDASLCALASAVAAESSGTEFIALNRTADPELILNAMRSGIREFAYAPVGDVLPGSLARVREAKAREGAVGGKAFALLSAGGGCGTTTIACHLALELARTRSDQRILLCDLDPDGGTVGFHMGSRCAYNVEDALANTDRLDPSYWEALIHRVQPNLDVLQGRSPAPSRQPRSDEALREVLRFVRLQYASLVFDLSSCGPEALWAGLQSTDAVLLVSNTDISSLHRARSIIQSLRDGGIPAQMILSRVPAKPLLTTEEIQTTLGTSVCAVIPEIADAAFAGRSACEISATTTSYSRHISALAAKLEGREPAQTPRKRFSLFSSRS